MNLDAFNPLRAAGGLTLAALMLGAPVALATNDEEPGTRTRARIGFIKTDDDRADARSLEVVIENGDVTVTMDGKEVPDGRVIREDGKIVIRDADGREIRTIRLDDRPGHLMGFSFGDGAENRVWVAGDAAPAAEPTVMLGIQLGAPGPALEHHLRLEPGAATMIVGLYRGLPAHAAGLGEHDIITHIDGVPADPKSLRAQLAERKPGAVARLRVIQRGEPREVDVDLLAYDRAAMAEAELIGAGHRVATLFGDVPFVSGSGDNIWVGETRDLGRIFVDDTDRVFEAAPNTFRRRPSGEGAGDAAGNEELDGRLRRLDRRLADLQRALDAMIEEARRVEKER